MLIVLMVSSWIVTGFIAYENKHVPNTDDPLALFDKIYDKPWTRIGPYMIGMCVGWYLFKTNCNIRMNRVSHQAIMNPFYCSSNNSICFFLIFQATVSFGWFCSSFVLLWLIYGLYKVELGPFSAAAFSSLSHTAWAMGLAWIVVACSSGHGGYVNKILSAPVIYPFSRVTYCAYLVHPIAIRFVSLNSDATLHLGSDSMVSAKLEGTTIYLFFFLYFDCKF